MTQRPIIFRIVPVRQSSRRNFIVDSIGNQLRNLVNILVLVVCNDGNAHWVKPVLVLEPIVIPLLVLGWNAPMTPVRFLILLLATLKEDNRFGVLSSDNNGSTALFQKIYLENCDLRGNYLLWVGFIAFSSV
jgi:hypothetical protein